MKKVMKTAVLILLLVACFTVMVSCGGLDGRYIDEYGESSYIFDGKKVKIEFSGESVVYNYKIEKRGDTRYMMFYDTATGEETLDALEYVEGDGYIYLGGVKYVKEK